MTRLAGRLPYAEARQVLAEVGGVALAKSSVWRVAQRCGAEIGAQIATQEAEQKATARAWSTPEGQNEARRRMGIALDGAMVNIREEGWKELKLACVFEVQPRREKDERTGDEGEYGHAVQQSYVAHLGGPEPFGWLAWGEAQRRGWHQAGDTQMVADGAHWIWNLHTEHFHDSVGVVDWYHAVEHLAHAKELMYPQAGSAADRWYKQACETLFLGHAERIAKDLTTAAQESDTSEVARALRTEAGYFAHNRDRMQYLDLQNAGWLIGSGPVESGAKQLKARFSGPGMRWSRQGAVNLLPVRAAMMTSRDRFDALWTRAVRNSPPN